MTAKKIIEKLQLIPHPEGGYYRETYRAEHIVSNEDGKNRSSSTSIYYLLENTDISVFHRLSSDELWFYHEGEALEIVIIDEAKLKTIVLGRDIYRGEFFQAVIPAGKWFAARIKSAKGYSLVSCTVSPGFDFSDFEIGLREELIDKYPHLETHIIGFTKNICR